MFEDLAFAAVISRLFAVRPRIEKKGSVLVVSTGLRALIYSLGYGSRHVTFDPNRRLVRIRSRYLWLVHSSRFIPFDAIHEVLYSYADVSPTTSLTWAHQQSDLFMIGLKLDKGEEITLFRFYGAGDFVNDGPWPDWMYWGDMLEAKVTMGGQEGESRMLAEVMSGLIGVPIGNPMP